nr:substrate-binding domain-containing protein [Propionicimonas sp.]
MKSRTGSVRGSGKRIMIAGTSLLITLSLAACSTGSTGDAGNSGDAGAQSGGPSIAFVPKQVGNPYYDTSNTAARKAIEGFGGTFKEVGPTEATADGQVSYINTLTQQGVNGIVIAANDPSALCSAMNEARDAGISVLTYDADSNPECRSAYVRAASAQTIGETAAKLMVDEIGDSGEIAIMSTTPNATNQNQWNSAIEEYYKANYPNMNIVEIVYGKDEDQASFDKTEALLAKYPNLDGIIGTTGTGLAAALRYVSGSEFKGKVAMTGLCQPSECGSYTKDGTMKQFALWNPADLGTLAAWATKAFIEKKITGKEGETFTAEGISTGKNEFTIEANGIISVGDLTVFTKDNVDDFDF